MLVKKQPPEGRRLLVLGTSSAPQAMAHMTPTHTYMPCCLTSAGAAGAGEEAAAGGAPPAGPGH